MELFKTVKVNDADMSVIHTDWHDIPVNVRMKFAESPCDYFDGMFTGMCTASEQSPYDFDNNVFCLTLFGTDSNEGIVINGLDSLRGAVGIKNYPKFVMACKELIGKRLEGPEWDEFLAKLYTNIDTMPIREYRVVDEDCDSAYQYLSGVIGKANYVGVASGKHFVLFNLSEKNAVDDAMKFEKYLISSGASVDCGYLFTEIPDISEYEEIDSVIVWSGYNNEARDFVIKALSVQVKNMLNQVAELCVDLSKVLPDNIPAVHISVLNTGLNAVDLCEKVDTGARFDEE